jgi:protein SCO1/2
VAFRRLSPVVTFAFLWLFAGPLHGAEFRAGVLQPPRKAPDFTLKASNGAEFRLSRYQGKVVLLGFGYTYCPDVCPTTLADLALVRKKLGADAERVQVIYVTVDPERDTVERLRAYMNAFDKTFLGLTGTPEQLTGVRKGYGVSTRKTVMDKKSGAYLVHHSASIHFIDVAGYLRIMAPFGTSVEDMIHDVKLLLQERQR